MMKINYYDFAEAIIPDDRIKAVLEPGYLRGKNQMEFESELRISLEERLAPRLSNVRSLLILVDDITRQTPASWILSTVLEGLTYIVNTVILHRKEIFLFRWKNMKKIKIIF